MAGKSNNPSSTKRGAKDKDATDNKEIHAKWPGYTGSGSTWRFEPTPASYAVRDLVYRTCECFLGLDSEFLSPQQLRARDTFVENFAADSQSCKIRGWPSLWEVATYGRLLDEFFFFGVLTSRGLGGLDDDEVREERAPWVRLAYGREGGEDDTEGIESPEDENDHDSSVEDEQDADKGVENGNGSHAQDQALARPRWGGGDMAAPRADIGGEEKICDDRGSITADRLCGDGPHYLIRLYLDSPSPKELRAEKQSRFQAVITTLLHELVHAYLEILACDGPECRRNREGTLGIGEPGHGTMWVMLHAACVYTLRSWDHPDLKNFEPRANRTGVNTRFLSLEQSLGNLSVQMPAIGSAAAGGLNDDVGSNDDEGDDEEDLGASVSKGQDKRLMMRLSGGNLRVRAELSKNAKRAITKKRAKLDASSPLTGTERRESQQSETLARVMTHAGSEDSMGDLTEPEESQSSEGFKGIKTTRAGATSRRKTATGKRPRAATTQGVGENGAAGDHDAVKASRSSGKTNGKDGSSKSRPKPTLVSRRQARTSITGLSEEDADDEN